MIVEAVLFDVDDTLCEYRRSGAELLALAFEDVGVEPFFGTEEYYGRYSEFVDESDSMVDLRSECFAAIARDADRDPDLGRELAAAYAAERDHRNVRPLAGAVTAVERLAADHRVGVVTNGSPEMQRQKLETVGLADAFETVVHAGYDARAKPHPEPFERALAALDAPAKRAVHVGNSLAADVAGAHAAGVGSAWLSDGTVEPPPEPHYSLESLSDLHEPPW